MSCRTKLSSVSFSDSRKGPSNPYILSSATPQPLEGFDRSEAALYRKSILGIKKKDKNYKRRNTLGSSNVIVEFLNEKECKAKIRAISHSHSQDDGALTLLMNSCHIRPKLSSCSFKGVSDINKSIEFDEKFRDANSSENSLGEKKRNSFFSKMGEGRKAQIVLLDDSSFDIVIQSKLLSSELLDTIASQFSLKEKDYFGLAYKDETNHYHWLQMDRRVLEHEFPKRTGSIVIFFNIRFFIESYSFLTESITIELFYHQAKQAVFRERIECTSEDVFKLAALVLHETYGDYTDSDLARRQISKLEVLPTSVLREHPSIDYCENQIIDYYKTLISQSRGMAVVGFMSIVECLPMYGIHYYEVKDKSGIPWWLGLSCKGIGLYDSNDKRIPRRVFNWKNLENLYYREKKFSIEVHDPKRVVNALSSFNLYDDAIHEPLENSDELSDAISDPTTQVSVSRRTFRPGNVNVHAWFAANSQLTKSIWSMAVNQHQFYLDRKQFKQMQQARNPDIIAKELSHSTFVLSNPAVMDGIYRSCSSLGLSTGRLSSSTASVDSGNKDAEVISNSAADLQEYKLRQEMLEKKLKEKLEELQKICLQEAEFTGELPAEYPIEPGEPPPQIRKRVGTSFTLSPKIINQDGKNSDELTKLEVEYELQDKITKAAIRLAQEAIANKSVRKTRLIEYQKELQKLKVLEQKIANFRRATEKTIVSRKLSNEDNRFYSPTASPAVSRRSYEDQNLPRSGIQHPGYRGHDVDHRGHDFDPRGRDFDPRRHQFVSQLSHGSTISYPTRSYEDCDGRLKHPASLNLSPWLGQSPQPKSAPSSPVRQFYARRYPDVDSGLKTDRHPDGLIPSSRMPCLNHKHSDFRDQRYFSNGPLADSNICSTYSPHKVRVSNDTGSCEMKSEFLENPEFNDSLNCRNPRSNTHGTPYCVAPSIMDNDSGIYNMPLDSGMPDGWEPPGDYPACPYVSSQNGDQYIRGVYNDYVDAMPSKGIAAAMTPFRSSGNSEYGQLSVRSSAQPSASYDNFRLSQPQRTPFPSDFSVPDEGHHSYEGLNLSQTELTPSPVTVSSSSQKKPKAHEVSKPFEMSDFYKYSEKLRGQRQRDTSSQSSLSQSSFPSSVSCASSSLLAIHSPSSSSSLENITSRATVGSESLYSQSREPSYPYQPRDSSSSSSFTDQQNEVHSLTGIVNESSSNLLPDERLYYQGYASHAPAEHHRSALNDSSEVSFGSFHADAGLAEAFGAEMLEWYERNGMQYPPDEQYTLV